MHGILRDFFAVPSWRRGWVLATLPSMSRLRTITTVITVWALAVLFCVSAAAQNPKPIASFGSWQALTFTEDGKSGCYVISEPDRKEGAYSSRGKVYALVTHRPADQKMGVFTIIAGYSYQPDSEVTLEIGETKFTLFTQESMAWAADEDDPKIVDALKQGSGMVVRGISSRGTETVDSYSLIGFSKAYAAIDKACGPPQ